MSRAVRNWHNKIVTLETFSLAMQGTRLLSLAKPSFMLCMRRRSLQFAISRRDFFSSVNVGDFEGSELLVLKLINELRPVGAASVTAAAWKSPREAERGWGDAGAIRAFFGDAPPERGSSADRFAARLSEERNKLLI